MMTKDISSFAPRNNRMDFELRAYALRDYRMLVAQGLTNDGQTAETKHLIWILRELANIAYCSLDQAQLKDLLGVNSSPTTLGPLMLKIREISESIVSQLNLNGSDTSHWSRKQLLEKVGHLVESQTDEKLASDLHHLRSSIYTVDHSVWNRAVADQPDQEPWLVSEFSESKDSKIQYHRVEILRSLHKVLSSGLTQFEHYSQISEFGVRQISLLKIANAVHGQNVRIFPAEVGSVFRYLQIVKQIGDKRRFIRSLMADLHLYVGQFDETNRSLEYRLLERTYFGE
jgi:hypothetical protein